MSQAPPATQHPECPDWPALAARRDLDATGERLFDEALEHFDACPHCRAAACDAEPTLVFRRLPAPRLEATEIDAVRQAVHALRRGRALEAAPGAPQRRQEARRPSLWRAAALAAALTAALGGAWLLQDGGDDTAPVRSAAMSASLPADSATAEPTMNPNVPAAFDELELEGLPLVEDLDPALGTLIELHDDEVSIVMVVADNQEGFDV